MDNARAWDHTDMYEAKHKWEKERKLTVEEQKTPAAQPDVIFVNDTSATTRLQSQRAPNVIVIVNIIRYRSKTTAECIRNHKFT